MFTPNPNIDKFFFTPDMTRELQKASNIGEAKDRIKFYFTDLNFLKIVVNSSSFNFLGKSFRLSGFINNQVFSATKQEVRHILKLANKYHTLTCTFGMVNDWMNLEKPCLQFSFKNEFYNLTNLAADVKKWDSGTQFADPLSCIVVNGEKFKGLLGDILRKYNYSTFPLKELAQKTNYRVAINIHDKKVTVSLIEKDHVHYLRVLSILDGQEKNSFNFVADANLLFKLAGKLGLNKELCISYDYSGNYIYLAAEGEESKIFIPCQNTLTSYATKGS